MQEQHEILGISNEDACTQHGQSICTAMYNLICEKTYTSSKKANFLEETAVVAGTFKQVLQHIVNAMGLKKGMIKQ